jgi:uncharacterized protein YhdP
MFEDVRQALRDLLNGNVSPADRRDLLQEMRGTLVRGKMAIEDLKVASSATEERLARERRELETVRRRKSLAEGIKDAETVEIASKYEALHIERVAVIEKKLQVELEELAMLEREIEEMTVQFKAAGSGVGSGLRSGVVDETTGLDDRDAALNRELSGLNRQQRRAAAEADADARLAELKRRMGR